LPSRQGSRLLFRLVLRFLGKTCLFGDMMTFPTFLLDKSQIFFQRQLSLWCGLPTHPSRHPSRQDSRLRTEPICYG
jgi:hypothetical protein